MHSHIMRRKPYIYTETHLKDYNVLYKYWHRKSYKTYPETFISDTQAITTLIILTTTLTSNKATYR